MFRGWNKTLSDIYSCSFHALSKYEKTISSRVWTEAIQWSVTTHWRATKRYLLFEFLLKWLSLKAESPETLFHIKSNLLCVLCRCVVSFLFAMWCIFHCVRRCVVWEQHCMSGITTVTKGGRGLRMVNCWPSGKYVHLLYMYSILGRDSFCFNYCLDSAWHGSDQFVALLRWYGSPGFFDSGLQLICIFWSLVSHFPLDNTP